MTTMLPITPTSPAAASPHPPSIAAEEWRYEMRREAQEIIPHLWLGPFQASVNLHWLNSRGITHILCIRDRKEASMIFPRFPTEFRYLTLDLSDTSDQNIISVFPRCKDFIEEALSSRGGVLIHCNGGLTLAPAIVIGYLMCKYHWSSEFAFQYVQSKRYCVSPMSFLNQLKEYEPITIAQRTVQQAGGLRAVVKDKRHLTEEEATEEPRRKAPFIPTIDE